MRAMRNLTDREAARFADHHTQDGECWVWTGTRDRDWYGTFYFRGANRRAHRVSWYAMNGPIPDGMVINHTCRNRACVNPQHLNCITVGENATRDSASRSYVNSQKTTCRNGHPFDRVVTWAGKSQRVCSVCDRARRAAAKRRRTAAAKAALHV